jgi:hypothetical protein
MHWERRFDKLASRSRSALLLLMMLPTLLLWPGAGQAVILHEHDDLSDHAHRVALAQLSNWHAVHEKQHVAWSGTQEVPSCISQGIPAGQPDTETSDSLILASAAHRVRSSSRSITVLTARPSAGVSTVFASCLNNLLDTAPRLSEPSCTSPCGSGTSPLTTILRTSHALLV